MKLLVALLAMSGPYIGAYAQDALPNERLFDQCRTYLKYSGSERDKMSGGEAVQAAVCVAYMAGAHGMFNMTANAPACSLERRTVHSVISDYVNFTRAGGFLAQDSRVVVHQLFENCYCGRESIARSFCPTSGIR